MEFNFTNLPEKPAKCSANISDIEVKPSYHSSLICSVLRVSLPTEERSLSGLMVVMDDLSDVIKFVFEETGVFHASST